MQFVESFGIELARWGRSYCCDWHTALSAASTWRW